jgi:hypothetical protein
MYLLQGDFLSIWLVHTSTFEAGWGGWQMSGDRKSFCTSRTRIMAIHWENKKKDDFCLRPYPTINSKYLKGFNTESKSCLSEKKT